MDDEIRVSSAAGTPSVGDQDAGDETPERRRDEGGRGEGESPPEAPDWTALGAEVDRANKRLAEKGSLAHIRLHRHRGVVYLQVVDPRRRGRRTFRRVAPGEIERVAADLIEGSGIGIDETA